MQSLRAIEEWHAQSHTPLCSFQSLDNTTQCNTNNEKDQLYWQHVLSCPAALCNNPSTPAGKQKAASGTKAE
jgi:hypothetical protein